MNIIVHRDDEGRLTTTVYRKPTHTDQYLAYDSHHPQSVKRGVVKCLFDRAARIVSKPMCTAIEKQHVTSALASNGYLHSFLKRVSKRKTPADKEVVDFKSTVVLPFVDTISRQLRRQLEKHSIRAVFKSDTTIRKQLVRPKDPAPPGRLDSVVYKIPCKSCDKVYIGETGRPVSERLLEHRADVKHRRVDNSAVAEHAWGEDHHPDWDGVTTIARDKHWHTRRVKEAIQIRLHPNSINRDTGIDFPDEWLPTIRQHAPPSVSHRPTQPPASDSFPPTSASGPTIAPRAAPTAASDWSEASANQSAATPAPTARSLRYLRRTQRRFSSLPDEG